jgi:hypothetical protein
MLNRCLLGEAHRLQVERRTARFSWIVEEPSITTIQHSRLQSQEQIRKAQYRFVQLSVPCELGLIPKVYATRGFETSVWTSLHKFIYIINHLNSYGSFIPHISFCKYVHEPRNTKEIFQNINHRFTEDIALHEDNGLHKPYSMSCSF